MWLNASRRHSSYDFGSISTVPNLAKTDRSTHKQGIIQRDSLSASLKANERRLYLEERHKSVIAKADLMQRPDIVPKSHVIDSTKSDRLEAGWGGESQRGKEREEEDYEQRYREEKLTRQHAERQVKELKEKLLFYEDLSRQFSALKAQLSSTQTDLDSERDKRKETHEIGLSHTKGLIGNVKDLETINAALRMEVARKNEEIEEMKTIRKTILDQVGTEQDRLKSDYDHRVKSLQTEVKDLQQALEGESKSKRSIELLYADLYEKHRLCDKGSAPNVLTAVQTLQGKFQELEAKCMEQMKAVQESAKENPLKSQLQSVLLEQDKENSRQISALETKLSVGTRGKEDPGFAPESLDINTWTHTGKSAGRCSSTHTKTVSRTGMKRAEEVYEGKRTRAVCRHGKGKNSDV